MHAFAALYRALDATTKTNAKVAAMRGYFADVPPADGAWAVFFLTGQRFKRFIAGRTLRQYAMDLCGLTPWLVEDAHAAVGDSAETTALLLDAAGLCASEATRETTPLHVWVEQRLLPLRDVDERTARAQIAAWWQALPMEDVFILNKLLTGALRVGVSQTLVTRALAESAGLEPAVVAHRLMGNWQPTPGFFRGLCAAESASEDRSRPYPFFLASPLEEGDLARLGPVEDWLIEWKWDGIRAQVLKRHGEVFIWSRGEEMVVERYPEVASAAARLADGTVIDGELLAWEDASGVMPFAAMQRRIGKLKPGAKLLNDVPVRLLAYDLLELNGDDWRARPMRERRAALETAIAPAAAAIKPSPVLAVPSWHAAGGLRARARQERTEGLMLKRVDSVYGVGRKRGDWWKWKIEPLTIDAVLIYAQAGSGRRSNLFTDYTFACWRDGELVPVAKAYSGLDDSEIATLDRWIRRHTREKFGPVRSVEPVHVFELAFEGINRSSRHKSGVALRFPRIKRWRHDKTPAQADTLEAVKGLLDPAERAVG
ncbi:MAG: ATP-dependent DNA ligase [Geminicoccaceae bacterium]